MTGSRRYRTSRFIAVLSASTLLLFGVATLGSTQALAASDPGGSQALVPLKVAMVRSLGDEPFFYAKAKGYYEDVGLDVTIATSDSGPAVITGVINGSYDAAGSAAFPVLIAISKGAPLRIMPGATSIAPGHGESGLIVKPDSTITSYKDLDGKSVATNALTSLSTLSMKIAIKTDGGNPDSVRFVALPFTTSAQAVARGQVDAAITITPFATKAEMNGLKVIADPTGTLLPKDAPYGITFTSAESYKKKAKLFAAFRDATIRAIKELQGDPKLQRAFAVSALGITADVAAKVPLPYFSTHPIDLKAFQKYADLAAEYGYTPKPVDVRKVTVNP